MARQAVGPPADALDDEPGVAVGVSGRIEVGCILGTAAVRGPAAPPLHVEVDGQPAAHGDRRETRRNDRIRLGHAGRRRSRDGRRDRHGTTVPDCVVLM